MLVLDNRGGDRSDGGTRIVRIDLDTSEVVKIFPRRNATDVLPVRTITAGHIDLSDDGRRALVSVTRDGRVLEIDVENGAVLWEYTNTHDIADFLRAIGMETKTTIARFATYGAYYVGRPSFLQAMTSSPGSNETSP